MKWARHVAHMGEMRNAYNIFDEKSEWKRPLRRPRRRWEYNIRLGLGEIGWKVVNWMYLAEDKHQWWAVVNTVMKLRVSYNVGNFLISWVILRGTLLFGVSKLVS
jgi:hypothetical protein